MISTVGDEQRRPAGR